MVLQGQGRRQQPYAAQVEAVGGIDVVLGGRGDQFESNVRRQEVGDVDFRNIGVAETNVQGGVGAAGGLDVTALGRDDADATQTDVDITSGLRLESNFLGAGRSRNASGEQGCGQGGNGTGDTPGTDICDTPLLFEFFRNRLVSLRNKSLSQTSYHC